MRLKISILFLMGVMFSAPIYSSDFEKTYWEKEAEKLDYTEKSKDKQKEEKEPEPFNEFSKPLNLEIYQWPVLVILLLLVITALFYVIRKYKRNITPKINRQFIYSEEEKTEYSGEDLIYKIKMAEESRDRRNLFRYKYMLILILLAEKGLIQLAREYTNSEYLEQLRNKSEYTAFAFLTRVFGAIWYGKMELKEDEWNQSFHELNEMERGLKE